MQDEDLVPIVAVEDATRRFDNLAVTGAPELLRATATVRMIGKLLDMTKDAFDQLCSSRRAFECNVVGDCIKISQCRL